MINSCLQIYDVIFIPHLEQKTIIVLLFDNLANFKVEEKMEIL